jgi:hypothetical protein
VEPTQADRLLDQLLKGALLDASRGEKRPAHDGRRASAHYQSTLHPWSGTARARTAAVRLAITKSPSESALVPLLQKPLCLNAPRGLPRTGNRALLVLPHPPCQQGTARLCCHAQGVPRPHPAAIIAAKSRTKTGVETGVRKRDSDSKRGGEPPWAAPRAAAVPRVWGTGLRP